MHDAAPADDLPQTSVRIYLPDPALGAYVTFYYFVDTRGRLDDFLYPEWGNVRFPLDGAWTMTLGDTYPGPLSDSALFGPTDRAAQVISERGATAGFGMTPLGWERLVRMPADTLANRVGPLGEWLGRPGESILADLRAIPDDAAGVALFDRLLLDRLAATPPNSAGAMRADAALRRRPMTVEAFAAMLDMSPRALARLSLRVFGFLPKRVLRRQRFLETLGLIRIIDGPAFNTLIGDGYVDQPHFNREFRAFMGLSPRAYLASPRPLMGHAALVQQAAGIPLSFELPPQPA